MRSVAGKANPTLQLDLPLHEGRLDPPISVSSASRTEVTLDIGDSLVATAEQPDRPISFPMEQERVVTTLPEERSRETKLDAGVETETNHNPYHSLGRTEQDAVGGGTKLTLQSLTMLLDILRHLDAAGARPQGAHLLGYPAGQRGTRSADPARRPGDHSSDSVTPCAPGTSNPAYGVTTDSTSLGRPCP